jgi:hypothetical protein
VVHTAQFSEPPLFFAFSASASASASSTTSSNILFLSSSNDFYRSPEKGEEELESSRFPQIGWCLSICRDDEGRYSIIFFVFELKLDVDGDNTGHITEKMADKFRESNPEFVGRSTESIKERWAKMYSSYKYFIFPETKLITE